MTSALVGRQVREGAQAPLEDPRPVLDEEQRGLEVSDVLLVLSLQEAVEQAREPLADGGAARRLEWQLRLHDGEQGAEAVRVEHGKTAHGRRASAQRAQAAASEREGAEAAEPELQQGASPQERKGVHRAQV